MRSPNFNDRRDGLRPELVVLHYTAMTSCAGAARALCDPAREVSSHYLIGRDGTVLAWLMKTNAPGTLAKARGAARAM